MIEKSEGIKKFEEALSVDENLRNKYEAALKKIADEKLAGSDGEAMVKVAKELGFEINIDEMERYFAAIQELDDEELDNAAGVSEEHRGPDGAQKCDDFIGKAGSSKDEYGHYGICLAVWHCATAFLHTETDSKKVMCWSDYLCVAIDK